MLSYRHAFHAGNHADVLKHATLMLVLQSLAKKEKPFTLIDTHAGAGLYAIDDERAQRTGEIRGGIFRLLDEAEGGKPAPEPLKPYLQFCRKHIEENQYPGSPEIMRRFLRGDDKLVLLELHNNEIEVLRANMAQGEKSGVTVRHGDAYALIEALTPPQIRRGMLLMDPSYEVDSDFANALGGICKCHKRWPVGVLCLWYPLLKRRAGELQVLKAGIRECALESKSNYVNAELLVDSPEREAGLYGSGMAVINAPWQLGEQLQQILPFLAEKLYDKTSAFTPLPPEERYKLLSEVY